MFSQFKPSLVNLWYFSVNSMYGITLVCTICLQASKSQVVEESKGNCYWLRQDKKKTLQVVANETGKVKRNERKIFCWKLFAL